MKAEDKERLQLDGKSLKSINKHKIDLDDLMCQYICENDIIENNELNLLRDFAKFLKQSVR